MGLNYDSLLASISKAVIEYETANKMQPNTILVTLDAAKRIARCGHIPCDTKVGSICSFMFMKLFVVEDDQLYCGDNGCFYEVGYMGRVKQ